MGNGIVYFISRQYYPVSTTDQLVSTTSQYVEGLRQGLPPASNFHHPLFTIQCSLFHCSLFHCSLFTVSLCIVYTRPLLRSALELPLLI
jgi:hypothetical protein